jgi:hypothetical protein
MEPASYDDNNVRMERASCYDDVALIGAWFFLAGYEASKGSWMFPRSRTRRGTTTILRVAEVCRDQM